MRIPPKVHVGIGLSVAFLTLVVLGWVFFYLRAHPEARPAARRWGLGLLVLAILGLVLGYFVVSAESDSILLGLLTLGSFYAAPTLIIVGTYLFRAGPRGD